MNIDWDDAVCAEYYEAFCARHNRYQAVSQELVTRAELRDHHRVIDLGAGTGRTADAILSALPVGGRLWCVERAAAMRRCGEQRITDTRVSWVSELEQVPTPCARVVCSAALWTMAPLDARLRAIRQRLQKGGLLLFNIPSLYLGEPDEAGGGSDPLLLQLAGRLRSGRTLGLGGDVPTVSAGGFRATAADIDRWLAAAQFVSERWSFRYRLTLDALRDWMKIPVITNVLLDDLDAHARARRIDREYSTMDPGSFRWERWTCWRAEAV
jgi:hypothetical protein